MGYTIRLVEERWKEHVYAAQIDKSWKISRAIRKYGPGDFDVTALFQYPSKSEAKEAEKSLIAALDTRRKGYNETDGGDGGATMTGRRHSEETRAKMRATAKRNGNKPVMTPEQRRMHTENMRGREVSEEIKNRIKAGHARRRIAAGLPILSDDERREKRKADARAYHQWRYKNDPVFRQRKIDIASRHRVDKQQTLAQTQANV